MQPRAHNPPEDGGGGLGVGREGDRRLEALKGEGGPGLGVGRDAWESNGEGRDRGGGGGGGEFEGRGGDVAGDETGEPDERGLGRTRGENGLGRPRKDKGLALRCGARGGGVHTRLLGWHQRRVKVCRGHSLRGHGDGNLEGGFQIKPTSFAMARTQ